MPGGEKRPKGISKLVYYRHQAGATIGLTQRRVCPIVFFCVIMCSRFMLSCC